MMDAATPSPFSDSRFLCLESPSALREDDDEDEVNDYVKNINRNVDEAEEEQYIQILIDRDRRNEINAPIDHCIEAARLEEIQWIINTRALFRFRFRTAYLSVTYIDRIFSKGLIDNGKHWAIRLLSVACLSIAAKMIEPKVPALSKFPMEDYDFESKMIHKMELYVLSKCEWRMNSVTPLDFICYFISRFCREPPNKHIVVMTIQILISTTKDMNLLRHRSITLAMAATLMAMDQKLTKQSLEIKMNAIPLNQRFDVEDVYFCYNRMLEFKLEKITIRNPDLTMISSVSSSSNTRKRLTFNDDDQKHEKNPKR